MHTHYLLQLADNTLILGQRLSEWCGHGPVLEEDIALTNTALDYLGQATLLYREIAVREGGVRDEDQVAFLRDAWDYRNLLITELPNHDYAFTVTRQFLFSAWYALLLRELTQSSDEFLRGFAAKSLKEVKYHLQHSSDWVLRLGDGTEESHSRMERAIQDIWPYVGEMFVPSDADRQAESGGLAPSIESLRAEWLRMVGTLLQEATLSLPADGYMHTGGKKGTHTEHLGYILSDMQFLQRAYPGAKW